MVGVLRRFDGPRGGRCWNCSVRLTLHTGRLFYARPHKFLVVWRNNNFSEETDYLKRKKGNNRKRWGNLRYTIGIFSIRAIELFLFLSICYLYNICYYSIFREKKFLYNFYKYTSVEYRFISRIVAFEVGKYLQLTSREEIAQLLTTRTRKRVPFPPSSLPSPFPPPLPPSPQPPINEEYHEARNYGRSWHETNAFDARNGFVIRWGRCCDASWQSGC